MAADISFEQLGPAHTFGLAREYNDRRADRCADIAMGALLVMGVGLAFSPYIFIAGSALWSWATLSALDITLLSVPPLAFSLLFLTACLSRN